MVKNSYKSEEEIAVPEIVGIKIIENKHENVVLRTITRLMIPFAQLFGFYVIAYGHSSPGGGFQGGVILGASFILYALAYDLKSMRKRIPVKALIVFGSLGVMIFTIIGLLGIIFGGSFLEYGIVPISDPHFASELLIGGVETGIGMTVAAIMVSIFGDIYE